LTTFIDHRLTGRGETYKRSTKVYRQKGARRHPPDEKTIVGITIMQGGHREGLLLFRAFDNPAANLI